MTTDSRRGANPRTLEQQRAAAAWNCVRTVKDQGFEGFEKEYSALARGAPADIQRNGLGQTLAFWRAKGKGSRANAQLFTHVSEWVVGQLRITGHDHLLTWVMQSATTEQYRHATVEAMAFLAWLKRFAEAELKSETDGGV
jgi:CRISPR-associated protein Cmr5